MIGPAVQTSEDVTISTDGSCHSLYGLLDKIYMKISEGFKMPEAYTNSWETFLKSLNGLNESRLMY